MNPASRPACELQGWYVISLRPVGGHAGLRRAASARGAQLLAISPLRLTGLPDAEAEAELSEALEALWKQLNPTRRERLVRALAIVSSARLEELARQKGFRTIRRADSARPQAMVSALAEAALSPVFR